MAQEADDKQQPVTRVPMLLGAASMAIAALSALLNGDTGTALVFGALVVTFFAVAFS